MTRFTPARARRVNPGTGGYFVAMTRAEALARAKRRCLELEIGRRNARGDAAAADQQRRRLLLHEAIEERVTRRLAEARAVLDREAGR